MNAVQVFTYTDHPVRVIDINGAPFFVGKDVAEVLGYTNSRKALADHVDEEDKGVTKCDTLGGVQELTVINESGLYSLILQSKLPTARAFKRWVTSEVLPSIRKHGAYLTPTTVERVLADPDFGITLLQELKAERNKVAALQTTVAVQTQQIAEMKPKVGYYDIVLRSPSLVKTSVIAKDYGMGAPTFNRLLKKLGIQYKQGDIWLLYAKYQDKGYTSTETYHYTNEKTGEPGTQCWTKWTQKGRLFLYETLKAEGILPMIEREAA